MKELLIVNKTQTGYLDNIEYLVRAVTHIDATFAYAKRINTEEIVNIYDDKENRLILSVDRDVRRMLAGGIMGYFNELCLPLDKDLKVEPDPEMKGVVLQIIAEAKRPIDKEF